MSREQKVISKRLTIKEYSDESLGISQCNKELFRAKLNKVELSYFAKKREQNKLNTTKEIYHALKKLSDPNVKMYLKRIDDDHSLCAKFSISYFEVRQALYFYFDDPRKRQIAYMTEMVLTPPEATQFKKAIINGNLPIFDFVQFGERGEAVRKKLQGKIDEIQQEKDRVKKEKENAKAEARARRRKGESTRDFVDEQNPIDSPYARSFLGLEFSQKSDVDVKGANKSRQKRRADQDFREGGQEQASQPDVDAPKKTHTKHKFKELGVFSAKRLRISTEDSVLDEKQLDVNAKSLATS